MLLIRKIDIPTKSTAELRGFLSQLFSTVANAEPGSAAQAKAKVLASAIRYELAVRDLKM